jgi:hypothetical protein
MKIIVPEYSIEQNLIFKNFKEIFDIKKVQNNLVLFYKNKN